MNTASRVTLMLGAGIFALAALSGGRTYAQADIPNAYPNPYQLQENWAKLPPAAHGARPSASRSILTAGACGRSTAAPRRTAAARRSIRS